MFHNTQFLFHRSANTVTSTDRTTVGSTAVYFSFFIQLLTSISLGLGYQRRVIEVLLAMKQAAHRSNLGQKARRFAPAIFLPALNGEVSRSVG
jgi:hypothetical protein